MPIANEKVRVTVNGTVYERNVEPRLLLSDFLRHELGLTGTHVGCEHGVCGMCTILLNGRTARSCLAFAVQADGCQIRTVEGLGTADALHAIQEAFWEKHGSAVRLLHAGNAYYGCRTDRNQPQPDARGDPRGCW